MPVAVDSPLEFRPSASSAVSANAPDTAIISASKAARADMIFGCFICVPFLYRFCFVIIHHHYSTAFVRPCDKFEKKPCTIFGL